MALKRIDVGNDLSHYIVKPGWKISDDGYGLRTATIQFTTDVTNGVDFIRGEECPIEDYNYLHLHKQTSSMDALGVQIQTCDYVGIAPDVNAGVFTNPQITTANGLTSENISTNPNFFEAGGDGYTTLIAGTLSFPSPLGPIVPYMEGTVKKSRQSFVAQNGACFESENGGRFIGFVDPIFKHFYGKTNYLAPVSSFSGHFYTNNAVDVQHMIRFLGTTSYDNDWSGTMPKIVPEYFGTNFKSTAANGTYDQLLLAQVNVEDFGDLFKVSYEVRYSIQGWPDEVYRKSSIMP